MHSRIPAFRVGPPSLFRVGGGLFLIALLTAFLALTCERWFPAHVPSLAAFPGVVPLACCLGVALGCLAAGRRRSLLAWTPFALALALAAAQGVNYLADQPAVPAVADEIVYGSFFVLVALALLGPGQALGRFLARVSNRPLALALGALGAASGIGLFMACTEAALSPFWWFSGIAVGLAGFLYVSVRPGLLARVAGLIFLGAVLALAGLTSFPLLLKGLPFSGPYWSPYGCVDYRGGNSVSVNRLTRHVMVSDSDTGDEAFALALPYLLNRDAGRPPFRDVLVLSAGVGNEVGRALRWGAGHVDAVERDRVVVRLARWHHPGRPYEDDRVTVHLDEGRHFLATRTRPYDLIVYGLTDPPVMSGGLDTASFLLTRQAFADVRRLLKPGGVFVCGGRFREGWEIARLCKGLEEVFPEPPLVLTVPYRSAVERGPVDCLALFFAGDHALLRQAFQRRAAYFLRGDQSPASATPNGFRQPPTPGDQAAWRRFSLATMADNEYLDTAEDDWPFRGLPRRELPGSTARGMAVLAGLSVVLFLFVAAPRPGGSPPRLAELVSSPPGNSLVRVSPPHPLGSSHPSPLPERGWISPPALGRRFALSLEMFFLGAGFALFAARTDEQAEVFFGGGWFVGPFALLAILGTLLLAVLAARMGRPVRVWPYYGGLLAALVVSILFPLDLFAEPGRGYPSAGACLLAFAPVFLGGIVGVALFVRGPGPHGDFGAGLAGAVPGGLAVGLAQAGGFRVLLPLAAGCFLASAVPSMRRAFQNYAFWDRALAPGAGRERVHRTARRS